MIEVGDLIRRISDGTLHVSRFSRVDSDYEVVASGPGWTWHDGSATNPVPGVHAVEVWRGGSAHLGASGAFGWETVAFYRVVREATPAPSQPPALQPGWVATAELRFFENQGGMAGITFPSGWTHYVDPRTIDKLDWSPPPPPPWEPAVGERAQHIPTGRQLTIRAIDGAEAWVRWDADDRLVAVTPLSDLAAPKGGEA